MWAAPWISAIVGGGSKVVKVNVWSPAIASGESSASRSLTCEALMVTVQLSPCEKSTSGSSVNVVGPPPATAACAPLAAQEIVNQSPLTATASLNVIETFASTA